MAVPSHDDGVLERRDKSEKSKRCDPLSWLTAWDAYALAAAALGQLPFDAAMRHKACVSEIFLTAAAEGRQQMLGTLYDDLARKEWEDRSAKLGTAFDLPAAAAKIDVETLRRARALCDSHLLSVPRSPERKRPSGGGAAIAGKGNKEFGTKTDVVGKGFSAPTWKGHSKQQVRALIILIFAFFSVHCAKAKDAHSATGSKRKRLDGTVCHTCGKPGHLARDCRAKS